jgi:membrane-associated phospholipid phosphatase
LDSNDFSAYQNATVEGAPGDITFCRETDQSIVWDSQFSFPSGHSALIFAGMTVLFLILMPSTSKPTYIRRWRFV